MTTAPLFSPPADAPETVFGELLEEIRAGIVNHPRSLQKRIGPSEVGEPCTRALIHKLAQHPEPERGPAWKPTVGTAIHQWIETTISASPLQQQWHRYLLETRVTVGEIGGVPISGSCDLYDTASDTVVDWKALQVDELVATPDGWSPIGNLTVGDHVLGSDFQPHKVIGINDFADEREVFLVTFNDDAQVFATADHLWTVNRYYQTAGEWRSVTVRTEDLRHAGRATNMVDRIPAIVAAEGSPADLPIHPYVLGAWLGDGGYDKESLTAPITLGQTKTKVLDHIVTLSGANPAVSYAPGVMQVRPAIRRDIDKLGLGSHTAPEKFVPPAYMRGSRQQRADLLAGLLDTDGGVTNTGSTQFYTTAHQLAGQVADLVRSLGGWAKVWEKPSRNYYVLNGKRKYTNTTEYRVVIRMRTNPFQHNERSATRWVQFNEPDRPRRKGVEKLVRSVEPAGLDRVRCIAIDAPDQLFITSGTTLTHNTKGPTTMSDHRRNGPGPQYRAQIHLYGRGMQLAGEKPRQVMIVFLPRNGELSDVFYWSEPYDEQIALDALARANALHALIAAFGADQALALYPPCDGEWCDWCRPPRALDARPHHGARRSGGTPSSLDGILLPTT